MHKNRIWKTGGEMESENQKQDKNRQERPDTGKWL